MTLTKPKTSAVRTLSAHSNVKSLAGDLMDLVLQLVDNKLYPQLELTRTAANVLTMTGSELTVLSSDGAGGTTSQYKIGLPVLDGKYNVIGTSTINLSTGAVTGSFESSPEAPPAITAGHKIHMGFEINPAGEVHILWGVPAASPDANTIPWSDDALKKAFIELTSTAGGSGWGIFTDPANSNIVNMPLGGGAGGSGDNSFKVKNLLGSTATIAKGFIKLSSGEVLVSGNGTSSTDTNVDFDVNLSTILGASPANNTTYYLYIDRYALPAAINLTDDGRKVITVYDNTHFMLSTTTPDNVNPFRYINVGFFHSADSGTAWTGTGAYYGTAPSKAHDLSSDFFSVPEKTTITISSAGEADHAHGLSGEPQVVVPYFYDASIDRKYALDPMSHIVNKDVSYVRVSTLGLTFDTGDRVEVEVIYHPAPSAQVASTQTQAESGWFANTSTTQFAHNLSDMDDIKGISVIAWNLTTGRRWQLSDPTALVSDWDDDNVYLDWSGFTGADAPSSTLKYKVIAGGSPLPSAVPFELGGFTKFVGMGPGSYANLAAAIAAAVSGDSILVRKSENITSSIDINVSDIRVVFAPGVKITVTGGSKGIIVSGNDVIVDRPWVIGDLSGTLASAIEVSGDDCNIHNAKVEANDAGLTITSAYVLTAAANRNWIGGVTKKTAGAITAGITDSGGQNDYGIRAQP